MGLKTIHSGTTTVFLDQHTREQLKRSNLTIKQAVKRALFGLEISSFDEENFLEHPRVKALLDRINYARRKNLEFLYKRMKNEAKNKEDCLNIIFEVLR